MKRFSIIHDMSKCIVCGKPKEHIHEVFFGTANRKKSIEYGLCVGLCYEHHNGSNQGVHYNKTLDLRLKKLAQRKFQEHYPNLDFRSIFGKNYL